MRLRLFLILYASEYLKTRANGSIYDRIMHNLR